VEIALVTVLLLASSFAVSQVSAANEEVRFRGTVLSDERWEDTVNYGSYCCVVIVQEIMSDPAGLLAIDFHAPVCYHSQHGLAAGDFVECYGFYFHDSGPLQAAGWIVCTKPDVDYYVVHASLGDVDHDWDVDIFDVIQCAEAYGSTPSSPNWNPNCDIAEPYGSIDIFDIVTIAASYGEDYAP